ncbi:hypothetical protein K8I61_12660 [bacterium]|nr:hypothetical protein [bacterium]
MTMRIALAALLVCVLACTAFAQDSDHPMADRVRPADVVEVNPLAPSFDLFFQTYVFVANDRDFDRTPPLYDDNGQTSGYVLTTFRPGITWRPAAPVAIRYEFEVGENVWSANDLDVRDPNAANGPVMRHKEVWGEVTTPGGGVGLRTGYMYLHDPTHLVLDRYMGAGLLSYNPSRATTIYAVAGQVPDTTYEGLAFARDGDRLARNNFEHDAFVLGAGARFHEHGSFTIEPAVWTRWDKTEIDRPRFVANPLLNTVWTPSDTVRLEWDLVGQWGVHERAGLDNRDVSILAAASQLGLTLTFGAVTLEERALAFTSDDGDRQDQYDTAFSSYSGWSKSRTMILTLNWLSDHYDNIDERAAAQGAGLVVADQSVKLDLGHAFRLLLVGGAGWLLDGAATDDELYLGVEGQIGLEFAPYEEHVLFHLIGGGMLPGRAGAMLVNEIDQGETEPLGQAQGSMIIRF